MAKRELLKKIRLYVFDYDDNLAKSQNQISKKMLKLLFQILEQGKHIAIITGLGMHKMGSVSGVSELFCENIIKQIPGMIKYRDQIHIATENGGCIWHFDRNGKIKLKKRLSKILSPNLRRKILKEIRRIAYNLNLKAPLEKKKDLILIDKRPSEITLYFKNKKLRRLLIKFKNRLETVLKGNFYITNSSIAIDISLTNKENTVEKLAKNLNISLKETLVSGDANNDFGMLALPYVTSIYTGPKKDLSPKLRSKVIFPETFGPKGLQEFLGGYIRK